MICDLSALDPGDRFEAACRATTQGWGAGVWVRIRIGNESAPWIQNLLEGEGHERWIPADLMPPGEGVAALVWMLETGEPVGSGVAWFGHMVGDEWVDFSGTGLEESGHAVTHWTFEPSGPADDSDPPSECARHLLRLYIQWELDGKPGLEEMTENYPADTIDVPKDADP